MRVAGLRSFDEERRARIESRRADGAEAEADLMRALDTLPDRATRASVQAAYDYARGLDYDHPGLSASAYLAHPVRVTTLAIRLDPMFQAETGVIALLHNVLEVSHTTPDEIARRFGADAAGAIEDLTVDRNRTDAGYTAAYYARLRAGARPARVVKILDKLDNLFLLCLNPDPAVRTRYLDDLERHLVPLVVDELPHLADYFQALVADARDLGFSDLLHPRQPDGDP